MSNYRLKIQYDGTRYRGWQRQKNSDNTIQGKIEQVLYRLLDTTVEIDGAGRTDAGVHAACQIANFHLAEKQTENVKRKMSKDVVENPSAFSDWLFYKLNEYLPEDIRILKVEQAGERFHSRLSATGKVYEYHLLKKDCFDVFARKYSWQMEECLSVDAMKKTASCLLGRHDFKGFCSKSSKKKSTVRILTGIDIRETENDIYITYEGNGFLYNMVRIITGTIVEAGTGRRTPESVLEILEKGERSLAGETAPAKGLKLLKVRYD